MATSNMCSKSPGHAQIYPIGSPLHQPTRLDHQLRLKSRRTHRFVAKALALLLTVPPAEILWNFTAQHDSSSRHLVTRIQPPWPAGIPPGYIPPMKLILCKKYPVARPESVSTPGPLAFYVAALVVAVLLTTYAEISESNQVRQYLVWMGALLCWGSGQALGLGWIASALILLPLHVVVALVVTDVCGWFARIR